MSSLSTNIAYLSVKFLTKYSFPEFAGANSAKLLRRSIRVSHEYLRNHTSKQKDDSNYLLYKEGLQLLSRSTTAIIVIINGNNCDGDSVPNDGGSKTSLSQFEDLLFGCNGFMKVQSYDRFMFIASF